MNTALRNSRCVADMTNSSNADLDDPPHPENAHDHHHAGARDNLESDRVLPQDAHE